MADEVYDQDEVKHSTDYWEGYHEALGVVELRQVALKHAIDCHGEIFLGREEEAKVNVDTVVETAKKFAAFLQDG